ncbi:hypothetical protein S7711_09955 [Stachybotrys chartarum IBT 7711]|uniref:Rhodopsin domain-containing protein n=1 Tax=Stachybotrys chartarum (strain CBS 109288 / IBT 7711) TaxID=1280523 RepID=A0A084B2W6_STACB|nr:hypothetical protein S7711_09955 [Stachybotrys chartarum IBT 7711]KFA80780.1 hypothetical protein S40288_10338 [Stachybotrys chartarum IBT 40288]
MAEQVASPGRMGPGVPYESFVGAIWGMLSFATLMIAVRLYSRFHGSGRFYLDDGFVLFAYAMSLSTAVLWQWTVSDMYRVLMYAATAPAAPLPSTAPNGPPSQDTLDIFDMQLRWLRVCLVVELFFYTGLTSVKLAFLFFFRRLGQNAHNLRYLWWPNLLFTLAVYLVCIGTVQYECLVGSLQRINGWCNTEPAIYFTTVTLQVNAALDVISDLFSNSPSPFVFPRTMANELHRKWPKKLAIMSLLSLSVVTMAIAIVRAVDITRTKWATGQNDPTYLWLWSAIEPCVAVSCLSAFPQLFVHSSRSTKPVFTPSETYKKIMSRFRSKEPEASNNIWTDLATISRADGPDYDRGPYQEAVTPVNSHDSERYVLYPVRTTETKADFQLEM